MSAGSVTAGSAGTSGASSSQEALEGFTLLCKTSSGAQCVMVIQLVLKHPSIFVFGELLEIDSVKQLATTEHRGWFDVLKIFAYGTYSDYKSTPNLPELGEVELTKLKQLTLVNFASKQRVLPYAALQSALNLPDLRALENLIINSMYAGLLEGHLNQKDGSLEVVSAMGRDIGPSDVSDMIAQLGSWLASTDQVINTLKDQVARVQSEEEVKKIMDGELEEKKSRVVEELKANKMTSPLGGAGYDEGPSRKAGKKTTGKAGGVLGGLFNRGAR